MEACCCRLGCLQGRISARAGFGRCAAAHEAPACAGGGLAGALLPARQAGVVRHSQLHQLAESVHVLQLCKGLQSLLHSCSVPLKTVLQSWGKQPCLDSAACFCTSAHS